MKKLILFSSLTAIVIAALSFATSAENEKGSTPYHNESVQCVETESVSVDLDRILGEDDDPLPIRGKVKNNSGGDIQNVHVALYTPELSFIDDDYTDINGQYQIDEIVPDTYKLYFNKEGYEELMKTIVVVGGDPYFEVGIEVLEEE